MYFNYKRHESACNPSERKKGQATQDWRMRERLKTVSAALVLCLNIGVDPPDITKTVPAAKLECWVDPFALPAAKALEAIGKNLQQQYETLSMRTRYKQHLDPSVEDTKKFCSSVRRTAKDERILFHYNGHGVPRPTASGEIWVFNKNYTQYIPVSLYDLQSWLGSPCLYVYDCSGAGHIVQNFNRFVEQRESENRKENTPPKNGTTNGTMAATGPPPLSYKDSIQLAACGANEILPMNPNLPADLFTCCLTSPIEIALRFFVLHNPLPSNVTVDMVMKLPGRLQDRRTPLGELNWIFTAITDTIGWSVLPRALFKRLFRQDLMVAALFRNFLLAERIMRVYHCTPLSHPAMPSTHNHTMWDSWDLAVDACLSQLPQLLAAEKEGGNAYKYQHSAFFTEQLTAFEVWLSTGASSKRAPDQLPIVLQVLLSQVHRLRALILLTEFLDLGPWAVNLALSIGIFPYVLKLLQSPAPELKPSLVFIWARILAVDSSCQADLIKDTGYTYFIQLLSTVTAPLPKSQVPENRAMCAFILAVFCRDFRQGQVACMSPGVLTACLGHLNEPQPLLRHWSALCISQLWNDYAEAKFMGIREEAPQKLCSLLGDIVPEVRAAALVALSTFIGIPEISDQVEMVENYIAASCLMLTSDASSMVRKELVVFHSVFIQRYPSKFLVTAMEQLHEDSVRHAEEDEMEQASSKLLSLNSTYMALWRSLLILTLDPFPEVRLRASLVVDYVYQQLLQSPLAELAEAYFAKFDGQRRSDSSTSSQHIPPSLSLNRSPSAHVVPNGTVHPENPQRAPNHYAPNSGGIYDTLRRTASIALGLTSIGTNNPTSTFPEPHSPIAPSHPGPSANENQKIPMSKGWEQFRLLDRKSLPIKSTFFEWSSEYFMQSQMKVCSLSSWKIY